MPYLEIPTRKGTIRLLVDTGANKNYIAPRFVEQKFRIATIPLKVKNVASGFQVKEYVKWNPFSDILKETPLAEQSFFIFQFHDFFDGLIGYETLRTFNAIINTAENSLQIDNKTIKMQKNTPTN